MLLFPWFGVKLAILVAVDVLKLATQLFPWWSVVHTTGLFAIVLCLFVWNPTQALKMGLIPESILSPTEKLTLALDETWPQLTTSTYVALPDAYQREQVDAYFVTQRALLDQQPTHRDILINMAILSLWLRQPSFASMYLAQAQDVDPLHPLIPVLRAQLPNFPSDQ